MTSTDLHRTPSGTVTSLAVLLALALLLSACGHPTPYQASIDGTGYSDSALEEDRFRVTFAGNNLTPRETVENYLLYRAAELTLNKGYDYFLVVEKDTERTTSSFTTYIDDDYPYSSFRSTRYDLISDGYFDRFGPDYVRSTTRERHRYSAHANIQLRRGEKPADDPLAYDARQVLDRIGPTIVEPKAE